MKWLEKILRFILPSYGQTQSRTVRYAFPLVFAVATVLSLAAVANSTPSTIRVTASKTNVVAGDLVSLNIYVNATTPINAVDISLALPLAYVEFSGVDIGESVITLWTKEPYYEKGKVYFRGGTFRKGFKGEHLIGSVTVRAKTTGIAKFNIGDVMLLAGDGSGTRVTYDSNGNIPTLQITDKNGNVTGLDASGLTGSVTLQIITDIDGDGSVTLGDVSRFMAAWTTGGSLFDFNGDGKMTFTDFAIILSDSFFK